MKVTICTSLRALKASSAAQAYYSTVRSNRSDQTFTVILSHSTVSRALLRTQIGPKCKMSVSLAIFPFVSSILSLKQVCTKWMAWSCSAANVHPKKCRIKNCAKSTRFVYAKPSIGRSVFQTQNVEAKIRKTTSKEVGARSKKFVLSNHYKQRM